MHSIAKYAATEVELLRKLAPAVFNHAIEHVITLCAATQAPVLSAMTRRSPDPTISQLRRIHDCARKLRLDHNGINNHQIC